MRARSEGRMRAAPATEAEPGTAGGRRVRGEGKWAEAEPESRHVPEEKPFLVREPGWRPGGMAVVRTGTLTRDQAHDP